MASKQARSDRAASLEQMRRATARRERARSALIYGSLGVVLVLLIGAVTFELRRRGSDAGSASLAGVKTYPEASQQHTSKPVSYPQTPPAGGPHNPIWLNCGIYTKPVPNENAVHAMEHGAVWVTYQQGLSPQDVNRLRRQLPDTYVVMSPFPGLKSPVVVSAWGKQLALSSVDDRRLDAFVTKYRQGPQTPEQGATCSGGSDGSLPLDAGS